MDVRLHHGVSHDDFDSDDEFLVEITASAAETRMRGKMMHKVDGMG